MPNPMTDPNGDLLDKAMTLMRGPRNLEEYRASLTQMPSTSEMALQKVMANRNSDMPPAPPVSNVPGTRMASAPTITEIAEIPTAMVTEETVPPSGREMEHKSRQSIDNILSELYAQQKQNQSKDSDLAWMDFFAKMAGSKSASLLGAAGEGAIGLSDTMQKQETARRANAQSLAGTQMKYEQWLREQEDKEAENASQSRLRDAQAQYYGQDKFEIKPDGMGGYVRINKKTGATEAVDNGLGGGNTPAVDENGNPLTGDAYLKTLDPRVATLAQEMANGDRPFPTGYSLKNPLMMDAEIAARRLDPTANANRFMAVKAFNTGKQGDQVRSFNVAISHLNTLEELSKAMQNNDVKALNSVKNAWETQTGDPAPTNFAAAKKIVTDEIVKSIVGGQNAQGDREQAAKAVDAANSPEQLQGVIATYKDLMGGQLSGLENQYAVSTGRKDFKNRLQPESRSAYESHLNSKKPKDPSAGGGAKFLGFE